METALKLTKADAIKFYPGATAEFKAVLETTFGKDALSGKITDRLKSLLDAIEYLGLDPARCIPYSSPINDRQVAVNGIEEAFIAIEAINESWTPDYDNPKQDKWEIWWDMRNGRLVFYGVDGWNSISDVGSRLCFKNAELAKWAASQNWFIEICKKFMVRNNNCKSSKNTCNA